MGQLLVDRRDELQLAPRARPRAGPRLRRLARGLPPRRHGPFAAVLGAPPAPRARLPRAPPLAAAQPRRARAAGAPMRIGVVGHVEQVEFAVVETLPDAGAVAHASHWFRAAGGGGAVAAVQLRKLAGEATFLTALGSDGVADQLHRELTGHGVTVRAALRPGPHRRGFVHLEGATGEPANTDMGPPIRPPRDRPP